MKVKAFDAEIEIDESLINNQEKEIRKQIQEYWEKERESFELSISFPDSFTGEVMREMANIPYGETVSYGEIAQNIDSSPVAVGQACGRNPIPIIVPCHRVIGKNSLRGYSLGLELKKKLLNFEGKIYN